MNSQVHKYLSVKGSVKADLFFLEELHRLRVDASGLVGIWQYHQQYVGKSFASIQEPLRTMTRSSSYTDLNTEVANKNFEADCDDLCARFITKLQTQKSFRRRISSSNLGLLFTDAASTVMNKHLHKENLSLILADDKWRIVKSESARCISFLPLASSSPQLQRCLVAKCSSSASIL